MVEQHVTLDRTRGGPDAPFSMEPHEFAEMVTMSLNGSCLGTDKFQGEVVYGGGAYEQASKQYRRSLWLRKDVRKGERITRDHLAVWRPSLGLHPNMLGRVIGCRSAKTLRANAPLLESDLAI